MTLKKHDFATVLLGNKSSEERIKLLVSLLTQLELELREELGSAKYRTLGDTDDTTEGNIRYRSGKFQGYDGSIWNDFH